MEEQVNSVPILPSIDDCSVDGKSIVHTESNKNRSIIEFDPVITSVITRFEAVFKNHEKVYFDIGVANATVRFDRNSRSSGAKGQSVYLNSGTGNMENLINNHEVSGNAAFKCGQRVAAEVDMNLHTLHFFVDGVEQPNYVVNVPPAIRFFAFLWQEGSSFEVTQFIRRSYSSSTNLITGSKSWEWGKEWTVEKVKQPRIPIYQPIPPDYLNIPPPPFILQQPGPHPFMGDNPLPYVRLPRMIGGPPQPPQFPGGTGFGPTPNLTVNRNSSQSPPPRSPCTIPRTPPPDSFFDSGWSNLFTHDHHEDHMMVQIV